MELKLKSKVLFWWIVLCDEGYGKKHSFSFFFVILLTIGFHPLKEHFNLAKN
jgi:hypothetical protein